MCRIFAFRSIIPSKVHKSLLDVDNSLIDQSILHPDGWGVAYYVQNSPHIIKSLEVAKQDSLFQKVSGLVSSETVIAHLRKATNGELNILNTHPFQFGKWVFIHNGHIHAFKEHKNKILEKIEPSLQRFILGDTDSECLFFYFLSYLNQHFKLDAKLSIDLCIPVLQKAMDELLEIIGDHEKEDSSRLDKNFLSFVLTNGEIFLAYQGGKSLNYSTYKDKCSERDTCSYFQETCEAPDKGKKVQHLLFSSEEIRSENLWLAMKNRMWIGVDANMVVYKSKS